MWIKRFRVLFKIVLLIIHIEAQENNKLNLKRENKCEYIHIANHFCKDQQLISWCIPPEYNKEIEPWKFGDLGNTSLPYYYNFEFRIFDIQEVNDLKQTIRLDMYFYIIWLEPRLIINQSSVEFQSEASIEGGFVPMPLKYLEHLWIPDIEIYGVTYRSRLLLKARNE